MLGEKFNHDEIVYHKLGEDGANKGIVVAITYYTPEYFLYRVQWQDMSMTECKEAELLTKEEWDSEKVI